LLQIDIKEKVKSDGESEVVVATPFSGPTKGSSPRRGRSPRGHFFVRRRQTMVFRQKPADIVAARVPRKNGTGEADPSERNPQANRFPVPL
jgi:hypothetical protein